MSKNVKDWKKFREKNDEIEELEEILPQEEDIAVEGKEELLDEDDLLEEYELAKKELADTKESLMRTAAALKNAERIAAIDAKKTLLFGQSKFVESLLPVVDSLEQALVLAEKEQHPSMEEGLKLTLKLFLDALQKQGVEQLDPLGELFNPQEHEAMSIQETPDAEPNTVVMVFQKGYKLNERVIRPARVIVNSQ